MITNEQLGRLSAHDKEAYLALVALFNSDGWHFLEERLWNEYEAARARKEHASSWEQNRVAHGEVEAYQAILSQPTSIDSEFASEDDTESEEDFA